MPFLSRLSLAALLLLAGLSLATAQTGSASLPVVPASVTSVTFNVHNEGEDHPMIVTVTPTLLRVDEPTDRFSILYDPRTEYYTGLEHSNYTYWEFSWPEVKADVESSKRAEARLRDLGTEGLSGYAQTDPTTPAAPASDDSAAAVVPPSAADPNATSPAAPPPSSDDSGYVWRPTTDHKKIAGLDCIRWTGDTLTGESVEVWCATGAIPAIQSALANVRAINEPIALVPVRTLVPPFVFSVYDGLTKAGVTPILILWGGDQEKNRFAYVSTKTREGKLSYFTVPKEYMKTTLVTMDGIGKQKTWNGTPPSEQIHPAHAHPMVGAPQ